MAFAAENHSPVVENAAATVNNHKIREGSDMFDDEELESPKENGGKQTNGYERDSRSDRNGTRQPDVVEDHPGKSRSTLNSSHLSSLSAYQFLLVFY